MIVINPIADYSSLGLGRAFVPITAEVETIMANYSKATDKDKSALALFFYNIGDTIKNKLVRAYFPLFAANAEECLFDIVSQTKKYPSAGNSNGLTFDVDTKLARSNATANKEWAKYLFTDVFGESVGTYGCMQIMVKATGSTMNHTFRSANYTLTSGGATGMPAASTIKKFRGNVIQDINASKNGKYINYSDMGKSSASSVQMDWLSDACSPFGQFSPVTDKSGTRIVVFFKNTTEDEEATIRSAILAMDNAYFN